MKSLLSLACFIFLFVITGCAQKINEKDLPIAVKNAFTTKFPTASDIKWERESKDELEANFKMNNTDVSANFKLDGTWVETETTIPSKELPAAVSTAVTKKYPGATFERTEKIEKPGNKVLYEVNIKVGGKKKELEMDADGNIVK